MTMRRAVCWAGVAILGAIWYSFRPELLFIDRVVYESFPQEERHTERTPSSQEAMEPAIALARGEFRSVAHETRGTATIYYLGDRRQVLRLTDFETSNGPDVRVLLVAAADAGDSAAVKHAGFIELGRMKGNKGDQNYALPPGVDLETHRAVTIWCHRFSVNFGTASLTPASATVDEPPL